MEGMASTDTSDERPPFNPPTGWARWLWAVSPAIILLPLVLLLGWKWPYLSWVAFLGGVVNMYGFSAVEVWRRRTMDWELRAVPLTLLMLAANTALVVGVDWVFELAGWTPPLALP